MAVAPRRRRRPGSGPQSENRACLASGLSGTVSEIHRRRPPFVNRVYQPQARRRAQIVKRHNIFLNLASEEKFRPKCSGQQAAADRWSHQRSASVNHDIRRGGLGHLARRVPENHIVIGRRPPPGCVYPAGSSCDIATRCAGRPVRWPERRSKPPIRGAPCARC